MGDTYATADWGGSLRLRSSASTMIKSQLAMKSGCKAPETDQENYGENKNIITVLPLRCLFPGNGNIEIMWDFLQ